MYGKSTDARRGTRINEGRQGLLRILLIDTDPAFDSHRNGCAGAYCRDATICQIWCAHQYGAETAGLHTVRRTAGVQIDFIISIFARDPRCLREFWNLVREFERQRGGSL